MSGLEVVVAVANIVAGFGAGLELFRRWKKKRDRRIFCGSSNGSDVETSLDGSGALVQQEYDQDFGRLGRRFAVGDGMYSLPESLLTDTKLKHGKDIGRSQLQSYLITLQQFVIALLSSPLQDQPTTIHLAQLLTSTSTIRGGTISALASQYQRIFSSAPLTPSLSTITERARRDESYFPAAAAQQRTGTVTPAVAVTNLSCHSCKFGHANFPPMGRTDYSNPPDTSHLDVADAFLAVRRYKPRYKALTAPLDCTFVKRRTAQVKIRGRFFARAW